MYHAALSTEVHLASKVSGLQELTAAPGDSQQRNEDLSSVTTRN
jgi:hypothetical protein